MSKSGLVSGRSEGLGPRLLESDYPGSKSPVKVRTNQENRPHRLFPHTATTTTTFIGVLEIIATTTSTTTTKTYDC